jgi:hypothetical protein
MTSRLVAAVTAMLIGAAALAAAPAPSPAPSTPPPGHRKHVTRVEISPDSSMVAMSSDTDVPEGTVHDGDVVSIFGDVHIAGTVTGDVVVIMGNLDLSGTAQGDVVSILSGTTLSETARVEGDLVTIGYTLDRAPGSKVSGETVGINFMSCVPFSGHRGGWRGVLKLLFMWQLATLAWLFIVLLIAAALFPRRMSVIAAAFPRRWGWALLTGLITWAVFLIGFITLMVTIIGIPLAFALWFAMYVTKWLGLASILYLIGQTLGRNLFKRELPHLTSAMGGFVVYALLWLIPLFGLVFGFMMSWMAVGIAILTRFGAEDATGHGDTGLSGPPPLPPQPPIAAPSPPAPGA